MKKILNFGCALLIFIIILLTYFAIRGRSIRLANEAYDNSPDRFYTQTLEESDLDEFGIHSGKEIKIYYNQKCQPGDICLIKCLVDKCKQNDKNLSIIQQLKYIENDCYWFQGTTKPKIESGYIYESFDSRSYGFLCPDEFKMIGVVK